MKSIRTKIISSFLVTIVLITVILILISHLSIRVLNRRDSDELLEHMGRECASNIDIKLERVEHSAKNVYYYSNDQLESLFGKLYSKSFREEYLDKVSMLAVSEATGSDYVKSVYYQLTTSIKDEPNSFFYRWNDEKDEFEEMEKINISDFDKDDEENVGWYWLPKEKKEAVWIGPYYSEQLGMKIVTYVVPIYVYGRFTSVIGMDLDIDALCKELREVTVYDTGSVVLFDSEGNILFSKDHDGTVNKSDFTEKEENLYSAMNASRASEAPVRYSDGNKEMKLYTCELINGMTLCTKVPLKEINATSNRIISYSILAGLVISAVAFFGIFATTNSFLKPLKELTEASKQLADGKLDVHLHYKGNDEIGQLSDTFGLMATSLKRYFDHFHSLAYTDSLTGLNNKAAYTITKEVIESEVRMGRAAFTIIVMDVNNLKKINDSIGHEKGDILLQHVTICLRKALVGFPIYRIGGDEFCSIINDDNAGHLIERLQAVTEQMSQEDLGLFHCSYQIAAGSATYQKGIDLDFDDVFNRADQAMYENKKYLKSLDKKENEDISE